MNRKPGTAALAISGSRLLQRQRRVPGHPAGGKRSDEVKTQRSSETIAEFGPAWIAIPKEEFMKNANRQRKASTVRTIFPVILRITFSLALWTLGATSITLAEARPNERIGDQRETQELKIDRARVENLQRWVDSGHSDWCKDPQLVASAALAQIAPEFSGAELASASLPIELENRGRTRAVYAYHSLDGRMTYRITLRRFDWQLKTAVSPEARVWIPVSSEKITHKILD